jgi:[protein-PII] uridylyltransferase
MDLVKTSIGPRLGLSQPDTDVIVSMVEHHLLLPDVAMRRDLSDPATISSVASQVGDAQRLELLHALTESDSKATGPSAWGSWKEGLVNDLVSRVEHVLGGGDVSDATWQLFPDAATLERMATGETSIILSEEHGHDRLTVVTPDVPGAFSKVAGVLALHGIDVAGARAHSDEAQPGVAAMAASQVLIIRPKTGLEWQPVLDDLHRALRGELAIEARLAERVKHQRRRRATQAKLLSEPTVIFDDEASGAATVIEVHCESAPGVLHRITKALAELDLDIRHATVQTIGMEVVDTFYVRTRRGTPLTDEFHRGEVQRAVLHVVR